MKQLYPLLILMLFLSACDSGPNLSDICEKNQQICQEFTVDSWCKAERKTKIFSADAFKTTPDDGKKYTLLIAYEDYAKCVAFSTKIEHIKLKGKRTARINNYLKAKQRIKTLSEETKNSTHPDLLFYHWSRFLDKKALANFLAMEGSALLETPHAQYNLATYYIKKDVNKTLGLLFHALELHQAEQKIQSEIFKSLSTIFNNKKKFKQSYIWLKVLRLYQPEDEIVTQKTLLNFAKAHQLENVFLDKVANNTLEQILAGKFEAPKF